MIVKGKAEKIDSINAKALIMSKLYFRSESLEKNLIILKLICIFYRITKLKFMFKKLKA